MKKVEKSEILKVSLKGELVSITEFGITVKDLKEGTLDVLKYSELQCLIGKEITIAIQNKEEV